MSDDLKSLVEQFDQYFEKDIAQEAAKTIASGAVIQFHIHQKDLDSDPAASFAFTRANRRNQVIPGIARECELEFRMTEAAAREILADSSSTIAEVGVNILKLIFSKDPVRRVKLEVKTGFMTLFAKGYLGVLTAGGAGFAAALAAKGLNGVNGIRAALRKARGGS